MPEVKKPVVKPLTSPAERKAERQVKSINKTLSSQRKVWLRNRKKQISYWHLYKRAIEVSAQKHYYRMERKYKKTADADKKRYYRTKSSLNKAKSNLGRIKTNLKHQQNLRDIASAVTAHQKGWRNEGKGALYLSDGSQGVSGIIYISPSDSESGTTQSTITSYPVDSGAPRSNYSRESSRTVTLGGIITGHNRAEAKAKFNTLTKWQDNNREITYQGDFYYTHLLINSLQQSYDGFRDNIKCQIGLTFVYPAKINTQNAKRRSKSSKHVAGNRHKRYTAITIRRGDTLWGYSKKYHKSVSWLAKVNHIRNPNRIIAGHKIRVR